MTINLQIHFYVMNYLLILEFTKDKIEVTLVMPLIGDNLDLRGVIASDLGTDLSKYT